jgi:hypothetical protein
MTVTIVRNITMMFLYDYQDCPCLCQHNKTKRNNMISKVLMYLEQYECVLLLGTHLVEQ